MIYVVPYHETQASFRVIGDSVHSSNLSEIDCLYNGIIKALNDSKKEIIVELPFKGKLGPIIELLGVKSWAAFAKLAKGVAASLDEKVIIITPLRYDPKNKGFAFLNERAVKFDVSDRKMVDYIQNIIQNL